LILRDIVTQIRKLGKMMKKVALVLVALIAALHFYIAWFEMFAWTSRGPSVFDTFPPELFEQTIQMAANQGIYNAFLAVGLVWSLLIKEEKWQFNVAICFLAFVAVAGVVAAITVALKSGLPQLVPASIAMALLLLSRKRS
jgi:putative membrane protein